LDVKGEKNLKFPALVGPIERSDKWDQKRVEKGVEWRKGQALEAGLHPEHKRSGKM